MSRTSEPAVETLSALDGVRVLAERARQRLSRVPQDRWIVLLAGLLASASFALGEQVAIRDGLGWEGEAYARWVQDLPHEMFDVGIDAYCIQRVLPAAVLHYTFRALHISATTKHIVRGYAVLNVLSLMLVAGFWCATARRLKISDRGKWLGFIGLFLNFAVLKYSGYLPVMTDAPAFASGAAMLYFYLTRNRWGLWGVTALSAFVWPTQLYIGTILSLFPRGQDAGYLAVEKDSSLEVIRGAPWGLNWFLAGFVSWCWLLWSLQACQRIQIPMFGGLFPNRSVLPLSLCISTLYLFFGLSALLNDARLFRLPRLSRRWLVTAAVSIVLAVGLKAALQTLAGRPGYVGLPVYLFTIGITAVAKPGLFLVAHLVFYGPFWLLAMFAWRPICLAIQAAGSGVIAVAAIGLCHALDAESRHLFYLVPILVPYIVLVIDRWNWSRGQITLLVVVSLITSKCWLVIGGPFVDNANAYPDQLFWMNEGLFMADVTYVVQAVVCVACAIALYFVLVRGRAAQSGSPDYAVRFAATATSSPIPPRSPLRPARIAAGRPARSGRRSRRCGR